jgi:hypothetical protein
MKLLAVGADYRLPEVALVRAHVFDDRINVPSTIGAPIPEFGHVVSILKLRKGCVTAQVFGAGEGK